MTNDREVKPSNPKRKQQVSEEKRREILHLQEFYGSRKIAERVGLSRKVVRRVLQDAGIAGSSKVSSSKLTPFREAITTKVSDGLSVKRILREIKALGYEGERTILADFVRGIRSQMAIPVGKRVKRRFETRPAEEMQIDWSPYVVSMAGKDTRIHAFGALMCHSRKLFVSFHRDERQHTLLEALARSFDYFAGCPIRVVLDNMSTAVLGRIGPQRKPQWADRFEDFARHYGFTPHACFPRDPDRKGKKEKSFRLLEDDFLKGSTFESWEDLNRRLQVWLDETPDVANLRKHGTTGLVPNEVFLCEREQLITLPPRRFPVWEDAIRIVDLDSTLSIGGIRYTVPAQLAGTSVAVRLYSDHFEVLDQYSRVTFSQAYLDKSTHKEKLVINATHYANLPRRKASQMGGARIDEAFVQRYPELACLIQGIKTRFKSISSIQINKLLRLATAYGRDDFLDAALKAQEKNNFDAHAVERILEREHPIPPGEISPINGLGPTILGEVEEPTFDAFADFDTTPPTSSSPQEEKGNN